MNMVRDGQTVSTSLAVSTVYIVHNKDNIITIILKSCPHA